MPDETTHTPEAEVEAHGISSTNVNETAVDDSDAEVEAHGISSTNVNETAVDDSDAEIEG